MADQIYIGNFFKGLTLDRLPFNIDNDSFPTMYNFYSWRGRAKRKRGTSFLGILQRQIESVAVPVQPWQFGPIPIVNQFGSLLALIGLSPNSKFISLITNATQAQVTYVVLPGPDFAIGDKVHISAVGGMTQINGQYFTVVNKVANVLTLDVDSTAFGVYTAATGVIYLASGITIVPGSITLFDGVNTFTEPSPPDGTLIGAPGGAGLIVYTTGEITINTGVASVTGTFSYYPDLPVMGLEDFTSSVTSALFPVLLAFDTTYAYQINQAASPPQFYSVSYYKITNNPLIWTGQDFQQFWSTNYPSTTANFSGAFWATNNVPGFHFLPIATITVGAITTITTAAANNLITGDYVFFNEVTGVDAALLNLQTAQVTVINPTTFTVPINTAAAVINNSGLFQLLTNSLNSLTPQDGIRWYDGDPTSGTGIPTGTGLGWVNFAPPLTATSVSIDGTPSGLYYLVGALAILPFKDRLLFFSPYIQTSGLGGSLGVVIQLQDTVLWSWNGTPFYNALVPLNQTFNPTAYYVDQTGLGGYLPAGISQPIITVSNNEDVLLIGFGGGGRKTRFVYTGNDLQPFLFFNINSELPSSSTFSSVPLDKGSIDIGNYGIALTDQQSSQRIDLQIPDSVFRIQASNNGFLRVNAIRDFFREWMYFSYPVNISDWRFPIQTFLFNYRDNTWGIFYENFTHHGNFRAQRKRTWTTTGFASWEVWQEPWNTGVSSPFLTQIIAGNPQGYVLIKDEGTGEAISGTIGAILNSSGFTQIFSVNHCVTENNTLLGTSAGDYLLFSGAIGQTGLNGLVGKVISTIDENNFLIDIPFPGIGYIGGGKYTRLSQPLLQTKQFPFYWEQGRKLRLAIQKYLMDATADGKITVNINLSQDPQDNWNSPIINVPPNSLVYSQTLFTSPELYTNFCYNSPLGTIGNGILLTFNFDFPTLFSFVGKIVPTSVTINVGSVAVFIDDGVGGFTATGTGTSVGSSIDYNSGLVTIAFTIAPLNEVTITNFQYFTTNIQMPTAEFQYQIWHRFNTSLIGDSVQVGFTLSDEQMRDPAQAQEEITLHAMQLTIEASSLLA